MAADALQRLLGRGFSIAAVVGMVIGLGILRTPGEIAMTISEPGPYMMLWIVCGLFVLLSLLVVAELIAMTPKSGGVYALVAHAYGPYPGFLIGWTDWIAQTASMALKSVVMLEYLSLLIPGMAPYQMAGALIITSGFALLQLGGVRLGAGVQQFASTGIGLIMVALAAALFYGFLSGAADAGTPADLPSIESSGLAAYGLVVAAVVFTYDGWYTASYFGEEVKAGGRGVALGCIQATLIVFAIYVMLNLAIVLSVPLSALVGHELALAGALDLVFGVGAGMVIVMAAVFILLSHQNLQYMVSSRVLYSLSRDGLGTQRATSVNEGGTPAGAVILTWLTACMLILVGRFEFLLNLVTMLFMAMYVGLIVGVFRLRRIEPDAERPFLAWAFPWTGYVCALGWVAVTIFVAITNPMSAVWGLLLTMISIPVYFGLKRHRQLTADAH